jgi:hypothetical protein
LGSRLSQNEEWETLSKSHNDLNTTDNTGLTEGFSASTERTMDRNLKVFDFEISSDYFIYYFLTMLGV